ncbi:SRPBCC family protein [Arthrobacter sp. TMN-50]
MTVCRLPWYWTETNPGMPPDPAHDAATASSQHWIRAVDVECTADLLFAWTTQLRRAPYSYDLLDNFGRRSPQLLDPRLIDVRVGDPVMRIFTVSAVDPGRSFAVVPRSERAAHLFGALVIEYAVEPVDCGSRLVASLSVPLPAGPLSGLRQAALAWGDLVMMRKQLRELRRLAERDHRTLDSGP